ncbi:MAG: hypothetical protein Q4B28_05205 [bacterium]|nr:hypothetical protein [bacterium]
MAEILKKQQERKELTAGEKSQLNQLTTKIIEEGETIKKSKAEQQQRNQIKNYLNKEFGQALPLKKDVPRSFLPAGEKLVAGEGFVKKEKSILELDKRPNIL